MSFYLKPPKGLTNIHNLENTVRQRLICYDKLDSDNFQEIILEQFLILLIRVCLQMLQNEYFEHGLSHQSNNCKTCEQFIIRGNTKINY